MASPKGWGKVREAVKSSSYRDWVVQDVKKAKQKGTLAATLASSNPTTSITWWYIKHPIMRMVTTVFVMIVNLYVYLGDPASFSK